MAGETEKVLVRVGRRVAELRNERGFTQEALAERLGMQAPNYAKIEQGRANATLTTLARVAKGLGVDIAALFVPPTAGASKPGRPRKR